MRLILMLFLFSLISSPSMAQSPPGPAAEARCAVCGMLVAPYTNWVASLETPDGSQFFFDGPKDLFIYFNDLPRYHPGVAKEAAKLFVTEYYTVRHVPATEVFFVTGSDVMGPMGQELVPIAGRAAADSFFLDHSGARMFRFDGSALINVTESQ